MRYYLTYFYMISKILFKKPITFALIFKKPFSNRKNKIFLNLLKDDSKYVKFIEIY